MSEPQPTVRVITALIRRQPVRYLVSAITFSLLWVMPIIPGLIAAAFFDSLAEGPAGIDTATLVVAMWAWALARIALLVLGMWNHKRRGQCL